MLICKPWFQFEFYIYIKINKQKVKKGVFLLFIDKLVQTWRPRFYFTLNLSFNLVLYLYKNQQTESKRRVFDSSLMISSDLQTPVLVNGFICTEILTST